MLPNHVHLLVEILPKLIVSQFMERLKETCNDNISTASNLKYKFGNRNFWETECYVSTEIQQ